MVNRQNENASNVRPNGCPQSTGAPLWRIFQSVIHPRGDNSSNIIVICGVHDYVVYSYRKPLVVDIVKKKKKITDFEYFEGVIIDRNSN